MTTNPSSPPITLRSSLNYKMSCRHIRLSHSYTTKHVYLYQKVKTQSEAFTFGMLRKLLGTFFFLPQIIWSHTSAVRTWQQSQGAPRQCGEPKEGLYELCPVGPQSPAPPPSRPVWAWCWPQASSPMLWHRGLTTWHRHCGLHNVSAAAPPHCKAPPPKRWNTLSPPSAASTGYYDSLAPGTHSLALVKMKTVCLEELVSRWFTQEAHKCWATIPISFTNLSNIEWKTRAGRGGALFQY